MKNQLGFMLLELGLYCMLASFLAILFCTVAIGHITTLKKICSKALQECASCWTLERVVNKIQMLPADRSLWKVISSDLLVIKTESEDCGFLFESQNLYYLYGLYDQANQRWTKKRKELAVTTIPHGSWKVIMNNTFPQTIRAVILEGADKNVNCQVWICPGRSIIP